ncbi:MAG: type II toxin-antitoxin system HipA family toxin [Marinagarivorans sp.]|nr:type II toxin-antitoxin system HipA family toxin [Marinagarivorans sp.]
MVAAKGHTMAVIEVWGTRVGAIVYDATRELGTFEYYPEWIAQGIELAPLHMPLSTRKYSFPALNKATYKGLPAMLADTLPDDFGNAVIDNWLAKQGRDKRTFTPVERLLYTGKRGMGALEYVPAIQAQKSQQQELVLDELVAMAQTVLNNRQQQSYAPYGGGLEALMQVGTSAGGARAKAIITVNADRSSIHSGQAEAPSGYEHYLLKFDGVGEHSRAQETFGDPVGFGRMEYAYYLMAIDCGIDMMASELIHENGRAHFMTKRFDRIKGVDASGAEVEIKRHVQTLCAMDHADFKVAGAYSYEQLFAVARALRLSRDEALQIYRRMIFNVIARNHDDHPKNTAFMLDPVNLRWQLAPAYDIAYSYKPDSPWVSNHQLTLNGKRDNFTRQDLLGVAKQISHFRPEQVNKLINEVLAVVASWPTYASKAGVFDGLNKEIMSNLRLRF